MNGNGELGRFLETMRQTEGGNYGAQQRTPSGITIFGAYGMMLDQWEQWSSSAGLGGIDPYDPTAQDSVAGFQAQQLFQRYGSWDLVAAAWYAGQSQTDRAVDTGKGIAFFRNDEMRKDLDKFSSTFENTLPDTKPPQAAAKWISPQGAPRGWLMPVAGASEYSGGSWMPSTLTHRGRTHAAIDIYAEKGTPIVAPVGGTVLSVKEGKIGGFTARIKGDDGLVYYFAHMNEQSVLKPGQKINPGAHIGFVGNSGSASSTKTHVHMSIKKGNVPVNPKTYLDGATNSDNYYKPAGADRQMSEEQQSGDKLDGFLNAVSNQVAGGDRMDYRLLNLNDPEDEEGQVGSKEQVIL